MATKGEYQFTLTGSEIQARLDKVSQLDKDVNDIRQNKANNNHDHDDRYYTESEIDTKISDLQTSFQGGVDSVYNAIVAQGTTPVSKSLSDIVNAIALINPNECTALANGKNTSYTFTDDSYKLAFAAASGGDNGWASGSSVGVSGECANSFRYTATCTTYSDAKASLNLIIVVQPKAGCVISTSTSYAGGGYIVGIK